ncbi:galactokinase family protein [Aestuariimicrobium sp. Y1814]|uniref:galactokinase family protein n=1 Tax=Aestuariimicrobium sp. Y1814 TaxID=3418742 RepID=UPI003DA7043E
MPNVVDASPLGQPLGWFAPGRIEVLGKHTDYAGGRSLLAAVDRGVRVNLIPAKHGITARSGALPGDLRVVPGEPLSVPDGHWGNYLQTVVDRLFENFAPLAPVEITIDSDLPLASGMSSSSALVVGLAVSLAEYNGFTETARWRSHIHGPEDLAGFLACFENGMSFGDLAGRRGVGTFGGSEDHTAMLCCRDGHLGLFSFGPIREEAGLAMPADHSFVVAVSGVAAEKTGAARDLYNRAALAVTEILRRWNSGADERGSGPHESLAAAVRSSDEALGQLRALTGDEDYLRRRLEHFVAESEQIIPRAVEALGAGDLAGFGEAVDQSQHRASALLGNQVPQTEFLAQQARTLGAVAATSFGAGFGGSVWAMVPSAGADAFAEDWLGRYAVQYPAEAVTASTILTRPGGPIRPII